MRTLGLRDASGHQKAGSYQEKTTVTLQPGPGFRVLAVQLINGGHQVLAKLLRANLLVREIVCQLLPQLVLVATVVQ